MARWSQISAMSLLVNAMVACVSARSQGLSGAARGDRPGMELRGDVSAHHEEACIPGSPGGPAGGERSVTVGVRMPLGEDKEEPEVSAYSEYRCTLPP